MKAEERVKIAQLVRGDGTRMAGTKRMDARNGVMITLLLMLKKEADRSRGLQMLVMIGVLAGAS